MESNSTPQQLSLRAVTITDLNSIVKPYKQQKEESFSEKQSLTNHFGLPLYVAEWKNQIVGYSYAAIANTNDYLLKTTIDPCFSDYLIKEDLIVKTEDFFKNEWQNGSNKGLTSAINQLVNWLNNSNS